MAVEQSYKVAVYCDHWQNGGVEAYLMNLFRFWDKQKLSPQLVVSQAETDLYDNELKALGIPRVVTLQHAYTSPIKRILCNLSAMRRLLRSGGYDAVYFNLSNSFTMIYAWMAKRAGIKVRVVHSHCGGIKPSATLLLKQAAHSLGRCLFTRYVTVFFACSELAGRWMFGKQVSRSRSVHLIHNAVDTAAFMQNREVREQARAALGFSDCFVVGTVGRFSEQKNPFFLLECFQCFAAQRSDAHLLWIGEGELEDQVKRHARSLGLAKRVTFYGKTHEVSKMLWAMDVFCLPSRFEGNPVSVIEAQAAGCMCLVSDTVTEQCKITDNLRFLPIDRGAEVWAQAMESARPLCSPEEAARQVREHGYDAENMSAGVQEMLLKACATR